MQERDETPTESEPQDIPIALPAEIMSELSAATRKIEDLEREQDVLRTLQRALLFGFCLGRGLGSFDPSEWVIDEETSTMRRVPKEG